MTYKLNPIIEKIESPVIIRIPGEQRIYESGRAAAADVFDRNFAISALRADGGNVVITLSELQVGAVTWIGEEQENLFDG